jgi:ribonuclease HI
LYSLENKWDPRLLQPEDYKDYEEYQAPEESPDPDTAIFDSRITTDGTLADTFRIFTE